MTKTHPYLAIFISLVFVVGPWLQPNEVKAASELIDCNCCQGPCQGCCCSVPLPADENNSNEPIGGCHCDISKLPAVPELPLELHEYRVDNHSTKTQPTASVSHNAFANIGNQPSMPDKSSPTVSSCPAYVLFGAFLI